MSDDESDLTDLEDELSEDDYAKKPNGGKGKSKARGGKGKAGDYTLRGALTAPRATTYSTEALYKRIHSGDIDLNPDYQREVVWPESKQIGIIDSILRNFYIPPVIFAVNGFDDGTEKLTCIDGKQRLTSIHRFVEGLIPHKDPSTGEKLWYRDNPEAASSSTSKSHKPKPKPKKLLPARFRNLFDGKMVVCVEYHDLEDSDEREIFQRVQLGVALTPAEKLKIITTPRATFVRALQDEFLNNDDAGLGGDALAWDRTRGSDFRCLAQTIQCISASPKTTSIQATEKWLTDPAELSPAFAASIENTYRVYETLVGDPRNSEHFTKIAPIEFIMIGILVHRQKARLTLEGLAKAVSAMRADVRHHHEDIRNNGKVYKTMVAFIDGYSGEKVGRGEVCAKDAVEGPNGASGIAAGTKRKAARAPAEEDEDSDDDYAPTKRAAPRKRASPKKATALPTPAPSSTSAPAPTSTATPSTPTLPVPNGLDVVRQAKERLEAKRLAGLASVSASAAQLPTPNSTPMPFGSYNPHATPNDPAAALQSYALQQAIQQAQATQAYQQQHGTHTQQQHGAAGVAAALEAGIMGVRSGNAPTGPRVSVKSEPVGAPPFSASSVGSGGGYDSGGGSRYGSGNGGHRSGGYDERERGRGYEGHEEYGRGDKRYRERERSDRRW
ncbi:hypothetical protein K438DRAFT_1848583 [Mycena galopus ATCC 62051]|nr:hypothetical protein K438DRAFT_1848583 [Mycena galopus ATCC 62051]